MDKEQWLASLSKEYRESAGRFVSDVLEISQDRDKKSFFSSCGLYAVGSSLKVGEPRDIDITLVGLDFRAVFEYDGVYLQDPVALINAGIVLPEDDPDAKKSQIKENCIAFNGKKYYYDGQSQEYYSSLGTCTSSRIRPSRLVLDVVKRLCLRRGIRFDEFNSNFNLCPLEPYNSRVGDFIGARAGFGSVDFFIHGENFFAKHWKKFQDERGLPYVVLHEWDSVNCDDAFGRTIITRAGFPYFIDSNGRKGASL